MGNEFQIIISKIKKIMSKQTEHDGRFDEQKNSLIEVSNAIGGVNTNVESVQTTANDIRSALTTEIAALKEELLSFMSNNSPSGVVKSVQRGITTATSVGLSTSVDPNKCIVILNNQYVGNDTGDGDNTPALGAYLVSLTSTTLTITQNKAVDSYYLTSTGGYSESIVIGTVSWQVIEFY